MAVIFILPLKDKTKKELTCLMTGNIRFVIYNDIANCGVVDFSNTYSLLVCAVLFTLCLCVSL